MVKKKLNMKKKKQKQKKLIEDQKSHRQDGYLFVCPILNLKDGVFVIYSSF